MFCNYEYYDIEATSCLKSVHIHYRKLIIVFLTTMAMVLATAVATCYKSVPAKGEFKEKYKFKAKNIINALC